MKRKPASHLASDSQAPHSSPLSRVLAARGSTDVDSTLMAGQSAASTETPSPSALNLEGLVASSHPSKGPEVLKEPKKIFVVKVCELISCEFYDC